MAKVLEKPFSSLLIVLIVGILLYAGDCAATGPAPKSGEQPFKLSKKHTLVIGKVSENPKKHYMTLKPMVEYVVKHMNDLGLAEAKVLMAKDNQQMIRYLQQDSVDWVTETPFSAAIFEEKTGAEILLRKWKKGVPEYHTVFFARKDSGISTLKDLKGKTIAFEDPGSTSAYFIPAAVLIRAGMTLVKMKSLREKPPPDMVGYVFSGQEINTSTWVYRGLVDVGVFNNLDWNDEDQVPSSYRKEMKIFYKTKPFPRAIELVRKNLDPAIKLRLKQVLLNAHKDPKAKEALDSYQKTKKFDKLEKNALAGMDEVRDLLKHVSSELNR